MSQSLTWVEPHDSLPDPTLALDEPAGLVAAGLDLSTTRLEEAYRNGMFPWFSDGQPVLWWSPDPRMVLYTDEIHISHSLKKSSAKSRSDRLMTSHVIGQSPQIWPSIR